MVRFAQVLVEQVLCRVECSGLGRAPAIRRSPRAAATFNVYTTGSTRKLPPYPAGADIRRRAWDARGAIGTGGGLRLDEFGGIAIA
jgi:hypothetical protein